MRVEKDRNDGYLYQPGTPEAGWRARQEDAGSRCPLLPTETRKIELKLFFLTSLILLELCVQSSDPPTFAQDQLSSV